MLDDRKLSARALFDDSSHRQTQLAVRVHTGQTLCYKLPFHVYVRAGTPMPLTCRSKKSFFISLWLVLFFCHRTPQITSVPLASHYGLRSTTQRAVQCWMKAGQQLSRNLWVPNDTLISHISSLYSSSKMLSSPCVPLQIQFFKDCGEDDVCTTDLVLQAHMDMPGTRCRFFPSDWQDQISTRWVGF